MVKRRSEQSVNFTSILWAFFGIGVVVFWFWALGNTNKRAEINREIRMTKNASYMNGSYILTETPAGSYIISDTVTPTLSPTETPTPAPSITPTLYSVNFIFTYSYYNPKLGGWNCSNWDASKNDCVALMANGEDWHDKYGKVVACPPEIALGTVIEVHYPDAMKGFWTCKDRGGAITGKWIDFLDITQRAQWGESVSATLYPPTVPMEQITSGTH